MIVKQFAAAAIILYLGAMLGSCSPFSGYVADHWPHWAGGMPNDVPPRPGAPGYDEFIAHGQPSQVANPAAANQKPADTNVKTNGQAASSAAGQPPSDQNVGQGGLY
jgi:hypothetical protein